MKNTTRWLLAATAALAMVATSACSPSADTNAGPSEDTGSSAFGGALGTPEQEAAMKDLYDAAIEAGESQVVIYGPTLNPNQRDAFQARFPGIELVSQTLQGADRMTKLEQEKASGNHAVDLVFDGRTPLLALAGQDWCSPVESLYEVPAEYEGPEDKIQYSSLGLFGMVVNTTMMDVADAPKSWQDIADGTWSGHAAMSSPGIGGLAAATLAAMLTPEENAAELGMPVVEGLKKANITLVSSDPLTVQTVAQGEAPLGLLVFYPIYQAAKQQGAPIEFTVLEAGNNMWVKLGHCQIQGAPHPQASELYLNWLYSLEGQATIAATGAYPVIPGSPAPTDLPPLDEVGLLNLLPDSETVAGYDPFIREVIGMFAG
ncbi:MAG: extracellular solute-binding protein [Leucobacter sp.]|nr:extracellular solute-binding protein [Leucobacter sp.]